ncbi:hypothetical protein LCGC14_0408770 [marine sediment metagenome]|uniref:Uncharacterized protein n=1 Tax=marine sediment metagenome TaxID=412755 RepID=A0A0F9SUI5_9ZZZZ
MADEIEQGAVDQQEPVQPTEAELKAELDKAYQSGDFKAIAVVARKIDQAVRTAEKAELEVKRASLDGIKNKVAKAYEKAIKPLYDSGELSSELIDGIWISHDFGDVAPTVRLTKTAPKGTRSSGGGGGGKKFDISTTDMLAKHGEEECKDGLNFSQAWESSTDKNWRYGIRHKLLKLEGII